MWWYFISTSSEYGVKGIQGSSLPSTLFVVTGFTSAMVLIATPPVLTSPEPIPADIVVRGARLSEVAARAARLEALGFGGVGVTETNGNPFLRRRRPRRRHPRSASPRRSPSPSRARRWTWRIRHGTCRRSSGGRFALGLGSQVRAHIERRYGAVWSRPRGRACGNTSLRWRRIWDAWESGTELDFRGEFYSHTLMPPNFRPAPTEDPRPPVLLAAVRRADDGGGRRGRRRVPRPRPLHRGGPTGGHGAGAPAGPRAGRAEPGGPRGDGFRLRRQLR